MLERKLRQRFSTKTSLDLDDLIVFRDKLGIDLDDDRILSLYKDLLKDVNAVNSIHLYDYLPLYDRVDLKNTEENILTTFRSNHEMLKMPWLFDKHLRTISRLMTHIQEIDSDNIEEKFLGHIMISPLNYERMVKTTYIIRQIIYEYFKSFLIDHILISKKPLYLDIILSVEENCLDGFYIYGHTDDLSKVVSLL